MKSIAPHFPSLYIFHLPPILHPILYPSLSRVNQLLVANITIILYHLAIKLLLLSIIEPLFVIIVSLLAHRTYLLVIIIVSLFQSP